MNKYMLWWLIQTSFEYASRKLIRVMHLSTKEVYNEHQKRDKNQDRNKRTISSLNETQSINKINSENHVFASIYLLPKN